MLGIARATPKAPSIKLRVNFFDRAMRTSLLLEVKVKAEHQAAAVDLACVGQASGAAQASESSALVGDTVGSDPRILLLERETRAAEHEGIPAIRDGEG